MKRKIITIGIIVLLASLVALFSSLWIKQKKETKRQKSNFEIELIQELDRQQEISKKQFKELFEKEVATLKEYDIKPKQVENIIKIAYNYIDTLIGRDTLVWIYDTIREYEIAYFDVLSECNRVKGSVFADTVEITSVEPMDSLLIALYEEKRKCLFKRRAVKAIAISECKGDTLQVLRNLEVGK